jgi:drug/metabolite transporter (DMT)-like permease
MRRAAAAPVMMAAGAAFLVINDALVKQFAGPMPVTQIIAVRAAATIACCLLLIARNRRPLPCPFGRDLMIRTGFTVANVFAFVAAVTALPFSLAVFVDLTNILFVVAAAPFLLAERMTLAKLTAVAAGVAGAGVMLSVEAAQSGWLILLPLASALMGAGRELWTRKLGGTVPAEVLTLYAAVCMCLAAPVLGMDGWVFDAPAALAMVLMAGLFQGAAMMLMTLSLQWGEVSFVTPFRLTSLIWAAFLASFVFGETFTGAQLSGVSLIAAALLFLVFNSGVRGGRKHSKPPAGQSG